MENQANKQFNNSSKDLSQERLEDVLGTLEEQLAPAGGKKDVEKIVFLQKGELPGKKDKFRFYGLDVYLGIIKKPVLLIAVIEIVSYILALVPWLRLAIHEIVWPLIVLLDLFVFGWLMFEMIDKRREETKQGLTTVFLAGFGLGLIMAIFKTLWIREFWAIFNLIIEPVYMGMVALVTGLITTIFIRKKIIN